MWVARQKVGWIPWFQMADIVRNLPAYGTGLKGRPGLSGVTFPGPRATPITQILNLRSVQGDAPPDVNRGTARASLRLVPRNTARVPP